MLALILGTILALWFQQRYIGVLRPIWELRENEARLRVLFSKAQEKFEEASKAETYASYSIKSDLDQQLTEQRKQLDVLTQTATGKLDESNPAYKKVADELKRLAAIVKEWGGFADKLRALKREEARARAELASAAPPYFLSPPPTEPLVITRAGELLVGAPLTLSGFESRLAEIAVTVAALKNWSALNKDVVNLRMMLTEIDVTVLDVDNQDNFKAVEKDLNGVWYDLWQLQDFNTEEVKKRLSEIHKSISLIIASAPRVRAIEDEAKARALEYRWRFMTEGEGAEGEVPGDDAAREKHYRNMRRNADVAFIVVAFVIAVNTGLSQLYYDKPFGTARDYVNALLWGFGTQTALSAFTTGLQRLCNLRSPSRLP